MVPGPKTLQPPTKMVTSIIQFYIFSAYCKKGKTKKWSAPLSSVVQFYLKEEEEKKKP